MSNPITIFTTQDLINAFRQTELDQCSTFRLGVEIGYGTWKNPKAVEKRKEFLIGDSARDGRIVAGIDYGELLAEQSCPVFHHEARKMFNLCH